MQICKKIIYFFLILILFLFIFIYFFKHKSHTQLISKKFKIDSEKFIGYLISESYNDLYTNYLSNNISEENYNFKINLFKKKYGKIINYIYNGNSISSSEGKINDFIIYYKLQLVDKTYINCILSYLIDKQNNQPISNNFSYIAFEEFNSKLNNRFYLIHWNDVRSE